MAKYFSVCGYYIDSNGNKLEEVDGLIFKETSDYNEKKDSNVYWFGVSANGLKEAIKSKEPFDDFVVTSYE